MMLNLNGLRQKSRRWLPLVGWVGVVAIAVLLLCLVLYGAMLRPMQTRLDELQHNAASARANLVNAGVAASPANGSSGEQLVEFYKFFPAENESPQWLEKLVGVAEKNGLSLNDGEYKVTQDKVGKLMRYKITLPVQGKYPQIRKFLLSLKTEIPMAALEDVQFERKDIIDAAVQAKVKLVLYLVQAS